MLLTLPQSLMIYPPGYGGSPNNDMMDFGLEGLGGLAGCPSGDSEDENGICWTVDGVYDGLDPNFTNLQITAPTVTPAPPVTTTPTPTSTSDASLIAAIANAGTNALRSSQTPYVIPGTNTIYNPATGQTMPAVGSVLPAGSVGTQVATSTINSFLPYLGLGALALLLFYAVKR